MRFVLFLQMFWISVVLYLTVESIDMLDKDEKPFIPNATWTYAIILLLTGFLLVLSYLLKWKFIYKFLSFLAAGFAAWSIWQILHINYFAFSTEWWQGLMVIIHLPVIVAAIISIFVKSFRKRKHLFYPVSFIMKEK